MSIPSQPPVMTADEVADLLRVDRKTVYSMVQRKRIPFQKVGRCLRFQRQAIIDWLSQPTIRG